MVLPGWIQSTFVHIGDYQLYNRLPAKVISSLMVSIPGKLEPQGVQISALLISENVFRQGLMPQIQPLAVAPWSWEGPSPCFWHSACLVCSSSLPGRESARGGNFPQVPHRYLSWGTCYKSVQMPPFSLSWRWVCLPLLGLETTNSIDKYMYDLLTSETQTLRNTYIMYLRILKGQILRLLERHAPSTLELKTLTILGLWIHSTLYP